MSEPCAPLEKALGEAVLWMGHDSNCPWRYTNGKEPCRCEMPALRDRFVALLSAPSPVREPEGLDVERQRADLRFMQAQFATWPENQWRAAALLIVADHIARLTSERPADEADG